MNYKLTDNTKTVKGITLYQIEALRDFDDIEKGDKGGWVANDKILSQENGWIYKNALAYGGKIYGGYMHGGDMHGGDICDGDIYGGYIYGGKIYGGKIHGGEIYGGDIYGGKIHGGKIHGGKIHGGKIHGGEIYSGYIYGGKIYGGKIYGGKIYGGVFTTSPLQLQGSRDFLNIADDKGLVVIGCCKYNIDFWLKNFEAIGRKHRYKDSEIAEYKEYLVLCKNHFDRIK